MGITIAAAMKSLMGSNNYTSIVAYDYRDGSFDISDSPVSDMLFSGEECPFVQLSGSEKVHPGDRFMLSAFLGDLMEINENVGFCDSRYKIAFRYIDDKSDDYTWMNILAVVTRGNDGRAENVVCYISPMTTDEIVTKSIVENFTNDKHPAVFAEGVKKLLSPENDKKVAFIQFDIENFKLINSRYGEQKGTEILNFITNGLDSVCREEQVHVRLTADVYMIVMSYDSTEEIDRLIETIQSRLGQYQDIGYKLVFGVNLVSDKTVHSRKLGDRAAMARQSIKGNALTNVGYYSDQEKNLNSRKFIEDRMYSALENGEFVMYLQPKYCISTSEIVGAEALVRWIHPEKGLISPAEFIPIFERNNFIIKLDEYMWEQACKALRRWIDMGRKPLPVSVNISRAHLNSDKFIKTLDRLVEKYGIDKALLETEITETIENNDSGKYISMLKDNGYTLLMDDFGSGYSSLNMLKSTPFDVIKIDRDFFSEFMLSSRGKKIISHTISMSKDIGLELVAEGVETGEQAQFLSSCGCDTAQGFFYSKPVPLEEFEKLAFKD